MPPPRPRVEDSGRLAARAAELRVGLLGPLVHRHQHASDAPAERGEGVLDPRRYLCVGAPLHETVALEGPQRVRQRLLRYLPHLVVQLAEALRAAGEKVEGADAPAAGEQLD